MVIGEWRLDRVLRVWQLGYNLHLQTRAGSSGVIIDFPSDRDQDLCGAQHWAGKAAKILGKLGPENFLAACRGYPDLMSITYSTYAPNNAQ